MTPENEINPSAAGGSKAAADSPSAGPSVDPSFLPVVGALGQLRTVLVQIDHDDYTARNLTQMEGTIGGHVRHVLDHIRLYFDGVADGCIDYDNRQRETAIEADCDAALRAIDALIARAGQIELGDGSRPIEVRCAMTSDGGPCSMVSSVGREIAFVLSHTIHHFAMIGAMARAANVELPEFFGYAPSTVAYFNQQSCVQ